MPNDIIICNNCGCRLRDNVLFCFNCGNQVKTDPAHAYVERGRAYRCKGEYNYAFSELNKALKIAPKHAIALRERGLAYLQTGQLKLALNDFDNSLKIDNLDHWTYEYRGLAYCSLGKYDLAIKDFTKIITEIAPTYVSAYNDRGLAYCSLGKYDLAIKDFTKALEIDPGNQEAITNYEKTYILLEQENQKHTKQINDFPLQIVSLLQKYEVDMSKQVTFDMIKKKRKYWLELLHPDKNVNKSDETRKMAEDKLKEMNEVYRQLKEYFKNNPNN